MFENYNPVMRAVLETTLKLICEKELQATSMSLIAKCSGVSTGSIYHHFTSKEDIINHLFKAIVIFHGKQITNAIELNESIYDRFHQAWLSFVQISLEYPLAFQFHHQYSCSPYIYQSSKDEVHHGAGWYRPMCQLYKEAVDNGLFINVDPAMLVNMHHGSLNYLIRAHIQNLVSFTEDQIYKAIELCWNSASVERLAE